MAKKPPFRLILASGSPARRDLLSRAGYRFETTPAKIEEPAGSGFPDARTYVQHVAWLKAAAVAQEERPDKNGGNTIVLAADTIGWRNGQIIGKPENLEDARQIIRLLAGTTHELWTGVCLWRLPDQVQLAWQEMSRVSMKAMTDAELDDYLLSREWQGFSGAYAIQEGNDPYVRVLEGSTSNVIGLPMESLEKWLGWLAGW